MTETTSGWLPLFPLNAVLFPGGILPLRVFEARYVDMVSECMRKEAPFGVVLIKSGSEVGAAAEPESVGCLAHITELDAAELGVLIVRIIGGERFRILDTRELADRRLEARIEMIEADNVEPPSDEHVRCAESLKNVINNIIAKGREERGAEFENPFASPMKLDNAGWVANRWCEILPIPLKARQKLLELDDPQSRLQIVYQFLQQHQLL